MAWLNLGFKSPWLHSTLRVVLPNLLCILLVGGCSSGPKIKTWQAPDLTGPLRFKKIVALVIHPDAALRRAGEDELVRQIGADRTVPGYAIVSETERADVSRVKAKLHEHGIDGAVTMRIDYTKTESPAAADVPFYQYYDRAGPIITARGLAADEVIASVQTNIYSVSDEKLLWSSVNVINNPTSARQVVADVAKSVRDELRKQKLID